MEDDFKSWDVTKELNTIAQMYLNENHMQSLADLEGVPIKAFVDLNQKLKTQTRRRCDCMRNSSMADA